MSIFHHSPYLVSLALAFLGLMFGSFATTLIYRLPQEEANNRKILGVPSHCPHCNMTLKIYHKIPLLSWALIRGKCKSCSSKIPFSYPMVEFLTGLLFAISIWIFPFGTLVWIKGLICGYFLIILFFTDLTELFLPDAIQFPLILMGILFALPQLFWPHILANDCFNQGDSLHILIFHNGLQPALAFHGSTTTITWGQSLLGLSVGYLVPALLNQIYKAFRKTDGLGMGVFKMLTWLGAFWGWKIAMSIFGLAICLLIPVGIILFSVRRSDRQPMLPFGSFLAVATPLVIFLGNRIFTQ